MPYDPTGMQSGYFDPQGQQMSAFWNNQLSRGWGQFQSQYAQAQARQFALNNYNKIIGNWGNMGPYGGGYAGLYNREMGDVNQIGGMERYDINQSYKNLWGKESSDLVSRGLTGSTIYDSMRQEANNQRAQAMARSYDNSARLRLGVEQQTGGDMLHAAMGGINVAYPTNSGYGSMYGGGF